MIAEISFQWSQKQKRFERFIILKFEKVQDKNLIQLLIIYSRKGCTGLREMADFTFVTIVAWYSSFKMKH